MQAEAGVPYQGILETEINDELAQKLNNPSPLQSPYTISIHDDYYEKQESFLDNHHEWHIKDATGVRQATI